MIGALIIYGLVTSSLVAASAWAADRLMSSLGRPTRLIWMGALVVAGSLVALAPARRPGPVGPNATAAESHATSGTLVLRLANAGEQLPIRTGNVVAVAWVVTSAVFLGLFVGVQTRYARLRRGWPRQWMAVAAVRVAPAEGPAVMGVFRPDIVVPCWLLDRDITAQSLIVEHEAEHLRAHDPLILALGWVLPALMPWNAVAWWMASRLRLAIEVDCDARVLRKDVLPAVYGALLVDVAELRSQPAFTMSAFLNSPAHLERRLLAMQTSTHRTTTLRVVSSLTLAAGTLIVACRSELPAPTPTSPRTAAEGARTTTAAVAREGDPASRRSRAAARERAVVP